MPPPARTLTKREILHLLQANAPHIRALGVRRIGLFGSFARDQHTEQSDIDLIVEFEPGRKNLDTFMGLSFFLEDLFDRRVELVTTEALSPHIGPHILNEAVYADLAARGSSPLPAAPPVSGPDTLWWYQHPRHWRGGGWRLTSPGVVAPGRS